MLFRSRRPIFPRSCPLSIFGAGELNCRVRDGNGCGLSASVTRILCVCSRDRLPSRADVTRDRPPALESSRTSSATATRCAWVTIHLPQLPLGGLLKKVKPSTISTAQLHRLPGFHMPPIKQVIFLRSYLVDPVGNLISRRASHLDAFSAYPNRTWLPSGALGRTTGTPAVRPLQIGRAHV